MATSGDFSMATDKHASNDGYQSSSRQALRGYRVHPTAKRTATPTSCGTEGKAWA